MLVLPIMWALCECAVSFESLLLVISTISNKSKEMRESKAGIHLICVRAIVHLAWF